MSAGSPSISRRQFLAGCAGCAAAIAPSSVAGAQPPAKEREPLVSAGAGAGDISLEGRMAMADVERRFQQQRPQMGRTVRAVEDLGLDPTGSEPVNGKLGSALSGMSNTRIVFPKGGTFALSGHITAIPEGPIEIVGNGSSFVIPARKEMKSLTFVLEGGSLIRDITIDQSAQGALQELSIQAGNGVVRADNVTIKGYAPAKPSSSDGGGVDSMFSPIARTSGGVVQATNFQAVGGTAAGTHNEGDLPESSPENTLGSPMGIWVGQANQGTVQLANPKLRGWSNGIYGGRTKGVVEVRGGTFVNNFNSQTRLGGGAVVDGASMLLDDRQWSDKGPFKIGHQGVYAARVDPGTVGNQTDPIRFVNLKVVANSMREGSALFDWEPESGPGIVRNCDITNHLNRSVFLGEPPSAPAATNIMVDQSRIRGKSSAAVMEMQGRPESMIQQTCITTRGAGPGAINGARIGSGVSFGQCTSASGLAAPGKVGSGGNLSALPAPNVSSSAGSIAGRSQQAQKSGIVKAMVTTVFMIIAAIVALIGGVLALAALAGILGSTLVYLLVGE
jgi:hypothetical protein